MKFNWGTGILIFLILFLAASAVFIVFAMRQDVNLVHKDYYEKGVDYTEQMNVNARSKPIENSIKVSVFEDFIQLDFENQMLGRMDSGKVHLYRPSDSKLDITYELAIKDGSYIIPNDYLVSGRYIAKISWYTSGLKYEIEKPVNVR